MDIRNNYFKILNANLDDNINTLAIKAGDLEFELGEDVCQNALNELINPRRRIAIEIRWFLEETDDEILQIMKGIENEEKIVGDFSNLTILNTMENWFEYNSTSVSCQLDWLNKFYYAYKSISVENITELINKHRLIAKFSEASFSDVSIELNVYLAELENKVLGSIFAFNYNTQADIFYRFVQKVYEDEKDYPKWGFPQSVLNRYELLHGEDINELEVYIEEYIEDVKNNCYLYPVNIIFKEIDETLTEWENLSNPINYINFLNDDYSRSSKGPLLHVRDLVLSYNNDHKNYQAAYDLIKILNKHCQYFPDIKEHSKKEKNVIKQNNDAVHKNEKKVQSEKIHYLGIKILSPFLIILLLVMCDSC